MMIEADMPDHAKRRLAEVRDRMDLHRALLRGQGFYEWMSKPAPRGIEEAMEAASLDATPALRPLPVINFLDGMDKKLADAIVAEALPQDQDRFRRYLEHRPLGLGIITAVSSHYFILAHQDHRPSLLMSLMLSMGIIS